MADQPDQQAIFFHELSLAHRLLSQQRHDKRTLYGLHAPEVECISKDKVRKPGAGFRAVRRGDSRGPVNNQNAAVLSQRDGQVRFNPGFVQLAGH
jgi:hypothetical protein